jgi:hypothetical protein
MENSLDKSLFSLEIDSVNKFDLIMISSKFNIFEYLDFKSFIVLQHLNKFNNQRLHKFVEEK